MPEENRSRYRLEWIQEISKIPKEAWNALADPLETPILEWEWLHRMEISGSCARKPAGCPST